MICWRRAAAAAAAGASIQSLCKADAGKSSKNFIAVYLDEESSQKLRSEVGLKGANTQCDHVTLKFDPSPEILSALEPLFGTHADIRVLAIAEDEHCQAAYVEVRAASTGGSIQSFNKFPHITLSCEGQSGELCAPMYSNVLLERLSASNVFIKGQKVFRSEWTGTLPRYVQDNLDYPKTKARMAGSDLRLTGLVCCEDQ